MKKVLFVVSNIGEGGGAENSSRTLAKSLFDMGYDVDLLTFYDFDNEYDIWDLNRISFADKYSNNLLTKFYRFFVKYPKLLNKQIKSKNYDLVITNAEDANLVGLNTKKYFSKNIKLITVVRNYLENHPVYKYIQGFHKNADFVVGVSQYITENMKKRFGLQNIQSIYNPFDIDFINKQKKEELSSEDKQLLGNKTNLITVGRLSEQKNYFFLIDSLETLLKEKENLQWLILGDGPLKSQIIDYIKSKGLEDKIKLLGVKSNPLKYIYHSDVFVFGSTHEGFPRALTEAFISGIKIVSVNCPSGPSELLANEVYEPNLVEGYRIADYGVLVEMGNKQAFADATRYMFENNPTFDISKQVENITIEKISKQWDDLINKI